MKGEHFYVYEHRRADTGEVFYVGKGHGKRAHSNGNRNLHWRHIVAKHGRTVHIVEGGLTEESAFQREIALIAKHRSRGAALVNMTDGGEGCSGCARAPESEETRAKKRASAIGRPMNPEAVAKSAAFHMGRKRPPETLAKMSAALRGKNVGRVLSTESRAKLSAAATGKKHSDETRALMSANRRGKKKAPQSPEHRAKIAQKRKAYWERWRAERAATT